MAKLEENSLSEWIQWGTGELAFLGAEEARTECEQILEALSGLPRFELYFDREPRPEVFREFAKRVKARQERTPLAYLLGRAAFWEDWFQVTEGVFIPRPETEILIESFLNLSGRKKNDSFYYLDLGTGSGVIAVTVAKLFSKAQGAASDLCPKALRVFETNAGRAGVKERIQLIQADGLSGFQKNFFDVIFSNPPYIATGEIETLQPEVQKEPRLALDGGVKGLDFYSRMADELSCLKPGGSLWLEVGLGQAPSVTSLFQNKFHQMETFPDLQGTERVVAGRGYRG